MDYTRFVDKANELLTKYGQDMSVLNTSFTSVGTTKAIFSNVVEDDIPSTLIGKVDGIFFSTPNDNITTNNYVQWNGQNYSIVRVEPVNLTNQDILMKILVSSGG